MRLSDKIKLELMKYFRFKRSYWFVCSEGIHNADVNAIDGSSLIEVEIKISKSDFKKEFNTDVSNYWKSYKHKNYSEPKQHLLNGYIVPNKFYFCVPKEMVNWALDYLKDKNQKYGLIQYDDKPFSSRDVITIVKSAKNLHKEKPDRKAFKEIGLRTTSELINLKNKHNSLLTEIEEKEKIIKQAKIMEGEDKCLQLRN